MKKVGYIFSLTAIFLCFAVSTFAQTFPIEIEGDNSGDEFGYSTSCLKDKVIVGIPGKDNIGTVDQGEVRVYRNFGNSFDTIPYPGSVFGNERFGHAVTYIDDVSGDSSPDILVGAPGDLGSGAVYILIIYKILLRIFLFLESRLMKKLDMQ